MKTIRNISAILIISIMIIDVSAQTIGRSTLSAFGNTVANDGIFIQQTVGQPAAVSNHYAPNEIGIRQGFQQPLYFSVAHASLAVRVYPNPNNGQFSFSMTDGALLPFKYTLFDMHGKHILTGISEYNERVDIQLSAIESGIYHLQVYQNGVVGSYKVIVLSGL